MYVKKVKVGNDQRRLFSKIFMIMFSPPNKVALLLLKTV